MLVDDLAYKDAPMKEDERASGLGKKWSTVMGSLCDQIMAH